MYIIHFKLFANNLEIDKTGGDYVPLDSPILILFTLKKEYSKHAILKEFCKHLKLNQIEWIQPYNQLNEEWIIDLTLLRSEFEFLQKEHYLNGKITIEPKFEQREEIDEKSDESIIVETKLKFKIDPKESFIYSSADRIEYISDIKDSLSKFKRDYPNNKKCAFLMMKFEDSLIQSNIVQKLKEVFKKHDLVLLRADDKHYSDDLLANIRTYMHGCYFGVAIFERINSDYFNPNVSLEVGYMMALSKPLMFLKDNTLKSLHTDLIGKLYVEFDFQNLDKTLAYSTTKWLENHEIINTSN
ncbi:MAG: hypothetical protein K0M50_11210 [Prolixibacteraceae bacterium]|nr:hypothetical protein [Prolixibacteraceae bacterium]